MCRVGVEAPLANNQALFDLVSMPTKIGTKLLMLAGVDPESDLDYLAVVTHQLGVCVQ